MKHMAYSTEDVYCGWIARYYDFLQGWTLIGRRSRRWRRFSLIWPWSSRVAARTQDQAFAAVLFLYKDVLGKPLGRGGGPEGASAPIMSDVAVPRTDPALSGSAVEDTPSTPVPSLVDLLYGCGLRVSEPLELRIKDLLWVARATMGSFSCGGAKGGKDRRVPIPRSCVAPLRLQVDRARTVWEWDRANAPERSASRCPTRLPTNTPGRRFQWQWFWVFPAQNHCTDPRSGNRVRYHILVDCVQRSVQRAARKVGLDGLITPHVLRHAFATHSRESMDSLRQLLGHSSLETTGDLSPSGGRPGEQSAGRSWRGPKPASALTPSWGHLRQEAPRLGL
jgi:integrase